MKISDKQISLVFVLHLDVLLHSTEIISEVRFSARLNSREDSFHGSDYISSYGLGQCRSVYSREIFGLGGLLGVMDFCLL